jgi:hypothetical protein
MQLIDPDIDGGACVYANFMSIDDRKSGACYEEPMFGTKSVALIGELLTG